MRIGTEESGIRGVRVLLARDSRGCIAVSACRVTLGTDASRNPLLDTLGHAEFRKSLVWLRDDE